MDDVSIRPDMGHEESVHVGLAEEGGNWRDDRRDVEVSGLPNLTFMTSPDIPANVFS